MHQELSTEQLLGIVKHANNYGVETIKVPNFDDKEQVIGTRTAGRIAGNANPSVIAVSTEDLEKLEISDTLKPALDKLIVGEKVIDYKSHALFNKASVEKELTKKAGQARKILDADLPKYDDNGNVKASYAKLKSMRLNPQVILDNKECAGHTTGTKFDSAGHAVGDEQNFLIFNKNELVKTISNIENTLGVEIKAESKAR